MKYLVLVESPAKCVKIEKYLNANDDLNIYEVMATVGHITELKSLKNIDTTTFICNYELIESKKKNTNKIRQKIKTVDEVILACDNDREGESINYYICHIFNLPLTTKRIVFNEITETAIQSAIKYPKTIDMNIVHAQQARQILDLLVGFKISPMLWKFFSHKIEKSLSAGRCQTPALKIIYDNQRNIDQNEEKQIYQTTGYFANNIFNLNKIFETKEEINTFLNESTHFSHVYSCSNPIKVFKQPPEPFNTSRIQQVASNELRFSPKETMALCQKLYEGGYITYMRTDSKKYSGDFINSIKEYIIKTFSTLDVKGEKYINTNIDLLITLQNAKQSNEIQAHEAIRPTNISLFELPDMSQKERKLYKLIRENTLKSCMAPACFNSITATITACSDTLFTCTCESVDFIGWKIVSKNPESNKEYHYLQTIKQNSIIPFKKICARISFTNTKQHYTEARLVHLLEEKGIGRPSTFSMLVDKIQERGYVKKEDVKGKTVVCYDYELENVTVTEIETKREFGNEKGKLIIQPMGILIIEFLEKHFIDIFNYDYTKNMEDKLDQISSGKLLLYDLCNDCNQQLDKLIDGLKGKSKFEFKINDENSYIIGKYGPVIKCVETKDGRETLSFKSVKNVDLDKIKNSELHLDEIETSLKQVILGKYENSDVILKKGKYGLYVTWGDKTKTLKELGNRPMENITFEEIKEYLDEGSNFVREIRKDLSIRKGKKGDYIFYKPIKAKKPQFFDIKHFLNDTKENYMVCKLDILQLWIKEKYNI